MPVTFSCPCCVLQFKFSRPSSVQGSNYSTQRKTRSFSSMFGSFSSALSCFNPVPPSAPSSPTSLDAVWEQYTRDYETNCSYNHFGCQNDDRKPRELEPPEIITKIIKANKHAMQMYERAIGIFKDPSLTDPESRQRIMNDHEEASSTYYELIEENHPCFGEDGRPIIPVNSKYLYTPGMTFTHRKEVPNG